MDKTCCSSDVIWLNNISFYAPSFPLLHFIKVEIQRFYCSDALMQVFICYSENNIHKFCCGFLITISSSSAPDFYISHRKSNSYTSLSFIPTFTMLVPLDLCVCHHTHLLYIAQLPECVNVLGRVYLWQLSASFLKWLEPDM